MIDLDEIDNKLISLLEQDAWQRPVALARILHVSPATIRRRLKRLVQNGVVHAVATVASSTVALPETTVVVGLNVAHGDLDDIAEALIGLPEITWLAMTTGQFDIVVIARFRSMEKLHQFLRTKLIVMKGIKDSETFVCLHVHKGKHMLTVY